MIDLYSFDVFDTIITRKTAEPKGIFAIMEKVLQTDKEYSDIPNNIKYNFYYSRISAEIEARRIHNTINKSKNSHCEEVTIEDIYQIYHDCNGLADHLTKKLLQLELLIEAKCVCGIPENINKIKKLLENKKRVILISDMYLPKSFILNLLVSVDTIFTNIPLYVSSDIGLQKSSRNLYKYISKIENVSYSKWMHTGDGYLSDVLCPKLYGIKTKQYHPQPLLNYEKELLIKHPESHLLQILIGVARYCRLIEKQKNIGCVASIAFHLLLPYTEWVLSHATDNNINNLYFISRDGYIPKIIADTLIDRYDIPIATHYLYSSRNAWRLPKDKSSAIEIYSSITKEIRTIDNLSTLIEINTADIAPDLPKKLHNINTEETVKKIFNQLFLNEKIKNTLVNNWKRKREILLNYLKQEIDFSEDSFALVDVQGSGLTIHYLRDLIYNNSNKYLKCYYFYQNFNVRAKYNISKGIFAYNNKSATLGDLPEALCRAPHGKCIGYLNNKDKILPKLDQDISENGKEWINQYAKLIEKMTTEATEILPDIRNNSDLPIMFEHCISFLSSNNLEKNVATAIGQIPFDYDYSSKKEIPYSDKFSSVFDYGNYLIGLIRGHTSNNNYRRHNRISSYQNGYLIQAFDRSLRILYKLTGSFLTSIFLRKKR